MRAAAAGPSFAPHAWEAEVAPSTRDLLVLSAINRFILSHSRFGLGAGPATQAQVAQGSSSRSRGSDRDPAAPPAVVRAAATTPTRPRAAPSAAQPRRPTGLAARGQDETPSLHQAPRRDPAPPREAVRRRRRPMRPRRSPAKPATHVPAPPCPPGTGPPSCSSALHELARHWKAALQDTLREESKAHYLRLLAKLERLNDMVEQIRDVLDRHRDFISSLRSYSEELIAVLVRIEGVAGRKVHQVYSHNQSLKLFSRQGLVADTARGGGPLDTRSPVRASKSSDGMGQLLSAVRALPSPDTLWKYEQLANEFKCSYLAQKHQLLTLLRLEFNERKAKDMELLAILLAPHHDQT